MHSDSFLYYSWFPINVVIVTLHLQNKKGLNIITNYPPVVICIQFVVNTYLVLRTKY